jgi:cupin fold WbuC family metalloprotein
MTIPVFFTTDDVAAVGQEWYDRLKENALGTKKKRSRLCLHRSDHDPLHEMLIVFHKDALIQPHRHSTKTESFHIVFGSLDIILFDNDGRPARLIEMGEVSTCRPHVYRMNSPIWHSVIVRSEFAAIHEVTNGPFRLEESEFAPWAPEDEDALRDFLDRSVEQLAAKR